MATPPGSDLSPTKVIVKYPHPLLILAALYHILGMRERHCEFQVSNPGTLHKDPTILASSLPNRHY